MVSRRTFLGATLGAASLATARAATAPGIPGTIQEPARTLPIGGSADVIVCGAGPAGVTAAITAARAGARVRLFEAHGALGGVWTSSLLGYLLDCDKPGFNQELVRLTGNAVAMGEAAGATAACAALRKRLPHEVEWQEARTVRDKTRRA